MPPVEGGNLCDTNRYSFSNGIEIVESKNELIVCQPNKLPTQNPYIVFNSTWKWWHIKKNIDLRKETL